MNDRQQVGKHTDEIVKYTKESYGRRIGEQSGAEGIGVRISGENVNLHMHATSPLTLDTCCVKYSCQLLILLCCI